MLRRVFIIRRFRRLTLLTQIERKETPPMREHRLYEADWLIRTFGFQAHEVTEGLDGGNLDLEKIQRVGDSSWRDSPVDINRASKSLL